MVSRWTLIAFTMLAIACRKEPEAAEAVVPPVHVQCEPVTRGSVSDVRTLRGTVVAQPDRDAVVSPQVPGRIMNVHVREGDDVRAGTLIVDVESQPVRDALTQARAQLAQAAAQEQNASIGLARSQHLFERGIAARQEVDDATARHAETSASVNAARAAVDLAARNVARAGVRSPIDGTVIRVIRRPGELVDGTPATPVLEIADPTALEFLATAAPADLVQLRRDQSATLHFDAIPDRTFAATVRAVSPSIDPSNGLGAVRLALVNTEARPPLGLFGVASVSVGGHDALLVPVRALRGASSGSEVVVCDGNHARVRAVDVGQRGADTVEIVRGVVAGETVAVGDSLLGLTDGSVIAR